MSVPRPVGWEGWCATITGEPPRGSRPGMVDVLEREEGDELGRDYAMTPAEAERHALALIMAAAVARGEQGHTAALNRVARVLDAPTVPSLPPADDPRAELAEAERDAAIAALAEANEAQADAEAARATAVQEASRLRVELGELREALSGKTQHDAVAEVVAPLREAMGLYVSTSPADVVRHALHCVRRDAADSRPAREPMTHTSLASIERHGVAVGDRLECECEATPRNRSGFADEALLMRASVVAAGAWVKDARGCEDTPARDGLEWPLTVAEAPDAD